MQLLQKNLAIIIFSMVLVQVTYGQKVTRNVGSFEGVKLSVSANMYLTQGNTSSVVIEGSDDAIEHIETTVKNGVLVIRQDNDRKWWKSWNNKNLRIYITNPTFEQVSVSGSGNIKGENTLKSNSMYIGVSGSGKVDLNIKSLELDSNISGSGNMNLRGTARNTQLKISGSGNLNAEELASENCQVRISGSGNCRVQVDNSLDSRVSGSGNVYYKGNPEKLSNHSSGSGSIKKIG